MSNTENTTLKTEAEFADPLAIAIRVDVRENFCDFCVKHFNTILLKKCTGCKINKYCGQACQRNDWALHRYECKLFKGREETFYETLLKRVGGVVNATATLLIMKLYHISNDEKLRKTAIGKCTDRRISDLMTHGEQIKRSDEKMLFYRCMMLFLQEIGIINANADSASALKIGQELFDIFCKVNINSHSLFMWSASGESKQIGLALDLDVSAYNHSCTPNADFYTNGRCTYLVPLNDSTDLGNTETTFITYTELMQTSVTRQQYLKENYFFDCKCERCTDQMNDLGSSIKCESCKSPLPLRESNKWESNKVHCNKCKHELSHGYRKECNDVVRDIERIYLDSGSTSTDVNWESLYERAKIYLAPTNALLGNLCSFVLEVHGFGKKKEICTIYDRCMLISYPKNFSRDFLANSIVACHALLVVGEYNQASAIFDRIESTLKVQFRSNNVPFDYLLRHLRDSIESKTVAKPLQYLDLS